MTWVRGAVLFTKGRLTYSKKKKEAGLGPVHVIRKVGDSWYRDCFSGAAKNLPFDGEFLDDNIELTCQICKQNWDPKWLTKTT